VVVPTQPVAGPLIVAGVDDIFSDIVLIQPVGNLYVMIADPAEAPVTTPRFETTAINVLLLLQVPPPLASDKFAVDPIQ
jgi:hypothetical protein